jgi:type VI secretion system Hcp family effector
MRVGSVRSWVAAAVLFGVTLPAVAARNHTMTIQGVNQGHIRGDVTTDSMPIKSVTHDEMMAPGKSQHGTLTIVREMDAASPKLAKAMQDHELLSEVTVTFDGSGAGSGKVAQTLDIKNATMVSLRMSGANEILTLSYESVVVTYVGGGMSATDDWQPMK